MKSWWVCTRIQFLLINLRRNATSSSQSLILLLRVALAAIHSEINSAFRKYVCDMTKGFIELVTFMSVILDNKSARFFVFHVNFTLQLWIFDKNVSRVILSTELGKNLPTIRQFCYRWHEICIIQNTVLNDVTPTVFNITQKVFQRKRLFWLQKLPSNVRCIARVFT